jgi:ribosomal protein S17E
VHAHTHRSEALHSIGRKIAAEYNDKLKNHHQQNKSTYAACINEGEKEDKSENVSVFIHDFICIRTH